MQIKFCATLSGTNNEKIIAAISFHSRATDFFIVSSSSNLLQEPIKSAILDFLQKKTFSYSYNVCLILTKYTYDLYGFGENIPVLNSEGNFGTGQKFYQKGFFCVFFAGPFLLPVNCLLPGSC